MYKVPSDAWAISPIHYISALKALLRLRLLFNSFTHFDKNKLGGAKELRKEAERQTGTKTR